MAHVRTYNPSVRIGNWIEEVQLEEDKLKDFLERRANGQLLIQRSSGFMGRMSNPIQLSTSADGCVRFGDTIMVVNKGNPDRTVYGVGQHPRDDSALAIYIPDIDSSQTASGPLIVSGTTKLAPCFRTAFKVMPSSDSVNIGDKLRYGQPFYLMTAASESGELFVFSDVKRFSQCTEKARHQVVHLTAEKSFNCFWKIQHINPLLRLEYEHEPVLANDECIIQHCKTHQNLCVEEKCVIPTYFGRDYEISAQTCLDSHKAEMAINRWMLVMGVAGDQTYSIALNNTGSQEPIELKPSIK
ncbi:cilia- and flagella-associated protein 161-like [Physella acuta]|uniref:cilia- and flagella-associated protein 161-like n=1 Tax=Physella acuta TaxID=109671 RepID=UPI0027DE27DB|nr:cilia- and flagella-associated protein 161-like [Physella acuta]